MPKWKVNIAGRGKNKIHGIVPYISSQNRSLINTAVVYSRSYSTILLSSPFVLFSSLRMINITKSVKLDVSSVKEIEEKKINSIFVYNRPL